MITGLISLGDATDDLVERVSASFDECPKCRSECGSESFDMQDDVEIFRGPEVQPSLLHRQSRSSAADQYELIRVGSKVFLKNIESLHHGKCSCNSSSAPCTRSSESFCKLKVSDNGSTVLLPCIGMGV